MKKVVFITIVICNLLYLGCATSADIYTQSGELKRPMTPINTDISDLPADKFSQNSITELKADLVQMLDRQQQRQRTHRQPGRVVRLSSHDRQVDALPRSPRPRDPEPGAGVP